MMARSKKMWPCKLMMAWIFHTLLTPIGWTQTPDSTLPSPAPTRFFWDKTFTLRSSLGHRDNVLLSPFTPIASGFLDSSAEAMVMRIAADDHDQLFGYVSYEDRRYFDTSQVDHEQTVLAVAEYRLNLNPNWQFNANVQYVFINEIQDASLTEGDFGVIRVKGHSIGAKPSLRHKISPRTWLQPELNVTRQLFLEPLDDYWETGPKLILGLNYRLKSEATVSAEFLERFYDNRQTTSETGGQSAAPESLIYRRLRVEAADRHYWDLKRRWRTVTRLGFELNRDNGTGYFDYNRLYVAETIRWTPNRWQLEGGVRLSQYRYAVQKSDAFPDQLKQRETLAATARAQFTFAEHWSAFAEGEFELSDANEPSDVYDVRTVRAGIEFEF